MPVDLILDVRIFANAKIVYAILKTFPKNKVERRLFFLLPPMPGWYQSQ